MSDDQRHHMLHGQQGTTDLTKKYSPTSPHHHQYQNIPHHPLQNIHSPSPTSINNNLQQLDPPDIQTSAEIAGRRRNGSVDRGSPLCQQMHQQPNLLQHAATLQRNTSGQNEPQFTRDNTDFHAHTLDTRSIQRPLDPRTLETRFIDTRSIDSRHLDSRESDKHRELSQRLLSETPVLLQDRGVTATATLDRHGGSYSPSSLQYHRLSQQDLCHSQLTITPQTATTQPVTPETMVPINSLTDLGILGYQEGSNEALNSLTSKKQHPNGSTRPYGMPISGGSIGNNRYSTSHRINSSSSSCHSSLDAIVRSSTKCCSSCGCCKVFISLMMCMLIFAAVVVSLYFFIRYAPYQKRPVAEKEARDPCSLHPCQFGAICVPTGADNSPTCRCPDHCADEEPPDGSTEQFCGSDGHNYPTECQMNIAACRMQRPIVARHRGPCDPCDTLKCPVSQVCQVSQDRKPRCNCEDTCSSEVEPVCASDGNTYLNKCYMKLEGCRSQRNLDIIYIGACDRGENPCSSAACLLEEVCNVDSFGIARCECPPPCQPIVRPVCGSDNLTYDNHCELKRAACKRQLEIVPQFGGMCDSGSACHGYTCHHGSLCVERQGIPVCECPVCPGYLDPVCGSDGLSYNNECLLRAEACTRRRRIDVQYRGRCRGCEDVHCRYNSVCEAPVVGRGHCVCPTACDKAESPVCGTDGVTYVSECQLKVTACQQQRDIKVATRGDCDLCKHVECKYGARCEAGQCLCPTACPDTREPVCGTNGVTYLNECTMQRMACTSGLPTLRAAFFGECSEARSSGVNYELVPCNGGTPLVNPSTGRDYYCGEGPDKELCPHGSYCHWSLSFAKCCPLDNDTTDVYPEEVGCRASQYLCCPDGVTDAKGDNFAGCPSICQCHKLGAYEDTCDPVTNQCRCKPGVGGTKCDRCEPGFWGLPMIQRGSDGCLPCGCSLFGSVRDDCEQMTGQCVCKPGIGGKKCNMCPDGLILGPRGCQPESIHATPAPSSCDELECYFGARCHKQAGHVECVCDAQCPADSSNVTPVCGSDGETYGSECHLKLFACRYQKDVVMDRLGPCNMPVNTPDHEAARMNPCLRDPCHGGGTCTPLSGGGFSCQCTDDKTGPLCESHSKPPYDTPAFQGDSYLEIKKIKAYNKVQIEIEFRSFSPNGILLYTQQQHDGQGDYLSLAVVDGFIEFRYNLGSGSVVIRSHQKITPRRFHRVVAKRYQKDGILQVDSSEDAIGKAPGHLKSLDLRGSTYIGYVPGAAPRVWENTGTTDGLVGCIKSIRINGRPLDLVWPGSAHLISASMISECQSSPCYDLPCLNRGACRPATDLGPPGFKCLCAQGYSGDRCEVRDDPCSGGPCMEGGTCVPLPDQGFMCQCPPGRSGLLCDVVDRSLREIVVPEFDGDSYLELPTLENVGTSFAIEVWFMTHSPDGLLLYNGQGSGGGDFVALNLRRGHLEFVYNLGSGHTTLVSKEAVELDKWHVARVRRKKRRGTLRLDKGSRIKGKSGAKMTQLNLNQKLYLGGMMNYSMAHPDSGVCCGLAGAIQRLVVNKQVIEDLPTRATSGKGVRRYRGTPCLPNLCLHGGVCEPFLDRFLCKCPAEYTGLYCDTRINGAASDSNKPVSMDGSSFLHFPDLLMFKSSKNWTAFANETLESFGGVDLPVPWSDIDLDYPSEFDHDSDLDEFLFLDEEDYDTDDSYDFESFSINNEAIVFHDDFRHAKNNFRKLNRTKGDPKSKKGTSKEEDSYKHEMISGNEILRDSPHYEIVYTQVQKPIETSEKKLRKKRRRSRRNAGRSIALEHSVISNAISFRNSSTKLANSAYPAPSGRKTVSSYGGGKLGRKRKYPVSFYSSKEANVDNINNLYQRDESVQKKNNLIIAQEKISSRKGRLTNHFQVKFRTTSEEGLLLWLGSNVGNGGKSPDYLAVAVVEGMVELSFRLGGKDHKFFSVRSKVRVTDGEWHTAVIHRRKKLGVLRVDRESPVKGVLDERGSATLDVDDNLYVGGLPHTPSFLPNAYQTGFRGCLDELQVQSRVLDLSSSSGPNGHVKYCDNM